MPEGQLIRKSAEGWRHRTGLSFRPTFWRFLSHTGMNTLMPDLPSEGKRRNRLEGGLNEHASRYCKLGMRIRLLSVRATESKDHDQQKSARIPR
jgi:hypothetical protein